MGEIRLEVRLPVAAGRDESLVVAATIHAPRSRLPGSPVFFAWAGASYTRAYYDVPVPGYSMAAYFNERGATLIALDHVGSGESSLPSAAPPDLLAAANHGAVVALTELAAADGDLAAALPADARRVGIGHSMGGHLVTRQQANHRSFDAVAILGWSADHTIIRAEDGKLLTSQEGVGAEPAEVPGPAAPPPREVPPGYVYTRPRSPLARWAFYPDGLDPAVIAADEDAIGVVAPGVYAEGSFSSPGFGRSAAAAIEVPVLLAFGDRDTTADALAEPSFYPRAPEITLVRLVRTSHCHNFGGDRERLWGRLIAWGASL